MALGVFLLVSACQAPVSPAAGNSAAAVGVVPAQQNPAAAAAVSTPTAFPPVSWNGTGPFFIAVVQSTAMATDTGDKPTVSVGPAAFAYDLDNKILLLRRVASADSLNAGLLIGLVTEVSTPSVVYQKNEILQGASQPRFMQMLQIEALSGALNFIYDGQSYSLLPGKSMSFDHAGATANAATITTVITNHGRLNGITSMPADGAMP